MSDGVEVRGYTVGELIEKLRTFPADRRVAIAMSDLEDSFSKVVRVDERKLRAAAGEESLHDFVEWRWADRLAARGPEESIVVIDFAFG